MKERKIGDVRTFQRYLGNWKIIQIVKDKNLKFSFRLNKLRCKKCAHYFGEIEEHTFNYLEVLEEGSRKLYFGIDNNYRSIILNDYIDPKIIEGEINKIK